MAGKGRAGLLEPLYMFAKLGLEGVQVGSVSFLQKNKLSIITIVYEQSFNWYKKIMR